jgi:hypothetical protein
MVTAVHPPLMARNDLNVRLDAEVVRVAKMVASGRGITLAEYLSESMRPIVKRDFEAEVAKTKGVFDPHSGRRSKGDER